MTFEREAERWGEAMGRKLGDPALGRQLAQQVKQQKPAAMQQAQASLIKNYQAVWTRLPQTTDEILVEMGTGCVFRDSAGDPFLRKDKFTTIPGQGYAAYTEAEAAPNIAAEEGTSPWMYLDSHGYVTIGVGHLIAKKDGAQARMDVKALNFVMPDPANPSQMIKAPDAQKVADLKNLFAKGVKDQHYTSYKNLTVVRLPQSEIHTLLAKDLKKFFATTRQAGYFPDFDTYPRSAKEAIFDMVYNVGPYGAAVRPFKDFSAAVRRRDWQVAAQESKRGPVKKLKNRNDRTRKKFEDAALIEPHPYDPNCPPHNVHFKFPP